MVQQANFAADIGINKLRNEKTIFMDARCHRDLRHHDDAVNNFFIIIFSFDKIDVTKIGKFLKDHQELLV